MPVAWFFCPYKVDVSGTFRYCAADDFSSQIRADGGGWAEGEILGNHAIVKVRASAATLASMDAAAGFLRVPRHVSLNDSLVDLTAGEKTTIQNKLNALGYSNPEIQAALGGDIGAKTLRDLLRFASSRWRRPAGIVSGASTFESTDWPRGAPKPLATIDRSVS